LMLNLIIGFNEDGSYGTDKDLLLKLSYCDCPEFVKMVPFPTTFRMNWSLCAIFMKIYQVQ
jgi:hypothetical protein